MSERSERVKSAATSGLVLEWSVGEVEAREMNPATRVLVLEASASEVEA
ncbi:hypothetical protein ACWDSJ_34890 [Nocardia sp. NPDC003482]